jgi:hypothetical protein
MNLRTVTLIDAQFSALLAGLPNAPFGIMCAIPAIGLFGNIRSYRPSTRRAESVIFPPLAEGSLRSLYDRLWSPDSQALLLSCCRSFVNGAILSISGLAAGLGLLGVQTTTILPTRAGVQVTESVFK